MIKEFTKKYQKIHIIGIGGRGQSALAQLLFLNNAKVTGSDNSTNTNTKLLDPSIAPIFPSHHKQNIEQTQPDLVIHTLAVDETNPELKAALELNIPVMTYPQAIGEATKGYNLISIAGSHGKTTTTGMLIHVFQQLNIPFNCVIGTTTSMLDNKNYHFDPKAEYFLLESCEYRQAFLNYSPTSAIITNMETDHFDFYHSDKQYVEAFQKFLQNIKSNLILNTDFPLSHDLQIPETLNLTKYSQNDELPKLQLQVPGKHNYTNALAAFYLCQKLNFESEEVIQALNTFTGVGRRQELVLQTENQLFFDDNAHTPTELESTIQAFKQKYPDQKLCLIWQPQGYIRVLKEKDKFLKSIQSADKVILTNILNSRDTQETLDQISEQSFYQDLQKAHPNTEFTKSIENTKANLSKLTENYPIVLLAGGHHDIRRVIS